MKQFGLYFLIFLPSILLFSNFQARSLTIPISNKRLQGLEKLNNNFESILDFSDMETQYKLLKQKEILHKSKKNLKNKKQIFALQQTLIQLKLSSQFGNSYEGMVQLGSDKKPLSALFDTGSSIIWFAGQECKECQQAGISSGFNCQDSDTCVYSKRIESLKYGRGACSGHLCTDNLVIEGKTIQNQQFIQVDKLEDFPQYPGDGLIGLGSEQLTHGEATIINNLYDQNLIQSKIFAMVINAQLQSYLDIGDINSDFFTGDIVYVPVQPQSPYWSVDINQIFMLNKQGEVYSIKKQFQPGDWQMQSNSLVIDSGTSIITFPNNDILAILKMLALNGLQCSYDSVKYNQIVCDIPDDIQRFPSLGVVATSKSGEDIRIILEPGQFVVCDAVQLQVCVVRISKLNIAEYAIFGDIFMQSFYTVFDVENQQIGFAQLSDSQLLDKQQGGSFIGKKHMVLESIEQKYQLRENEIDQNLLQDNKGNVYFSMEQEIEKQKINGKMVNFILGMLIIVALTIVFLNTLRQNKKLFQEQNQRQQKQFKQQENYFDFVEYRSQFCANEQQQQ